MTDGNDAPDVKIIPPLVYLAGIVIGCLASIGCRPRSSAIRSRGQLEEFSFFAALFWQALRYRNSRTWARQFDLIARPVRSSLQVLTRSRGTQCTSGSRWSTLALR